MKQLGIHIYDQMSDIEWDIEILLFNLLSALSWKKYMGQIHLYCNTKYLNTIQEYNIDILYDYINTDILDNKPNNIDYKQYWAFSKLLVLDKIKAPYTIIDTDLYLKGPIEFDDNNELTFYHKENFSLDYDKNIYIDFDNLIPNYIKEMNFDKSILPNNTAILNVKNDSFVSEWVKLSTDIAVYNKDIKVRHPSSKICFVEQRLLPMILEKKNIKYGTVIKPIFQSHLIDSQNGNEWSPSCSILNIIDPIEYEKFYNIKHLWGIKNMFIDDNIRNTIMDITIKDFELYLNEIRVFEKLFEKIYQKILKKYKKEI